MCRKGWGGLCLHRHQSRQAQLTSVPSCLPGGRWLSLQRCFSGRLPLPWMTAVPASSTSEARPFRGVGQVETAGLLIASLSHVHTRTRACVDALPCPSLIDFIRGHFSTAAARHLSAPSLVHSAPLPLVLAISRNLDSIDRAQTRASAFS